MYESRVGCADEAAEIDPIEMMVGRRSAPRSIVERPGVLQVGESVRDVLVQDLSMTGARLQLNAPLPAGTEALLIWDDLACTCRVRWSAADSCGVEFDRQVGTLG